MDFLGSKTIGFSQRFPHNMEFYVRWWNLHESSKSKKKQVRESPAPLDIPTLAPPSSTCAPSVARRSRKNRATKLGVRWDLLGHFYGNFMEIIGLKATGTSSASIWTCIFSICLCEGQKPIMSMVSGFLNPYLRIRICRITFEI